MIDVRVFTEFLSPEVATILISMLPIIELRGAIPAAIGMYGLETNVAVFWAIIGNMIPAFFLIFVLEKVGDFLQKRYDWARRFFKWLYERSLRKFNGHYEKYGALGVLLFVAIPLPMTGVWTASIASFLLGLRARIVIPYMFLGVLIAAGIVTALTLGFISL